MQRSVGTVSESFLADMLQAMAEQFAYEVVRAIRTVPFGELANAMRRSDKPSRLPKPTRQAPKEFQASREADAAPFSLTVSKDGFRLEAFGKVWKAKRRRDLVRRAKKLGLSLE